MSAVAIALRDEDTLALWGEWTLVERVDDVVDVDGVSLPRVGFTASRAGAMEITGAAAGEHASERAAFELAERASVVDVLTGDAAALVVRTMAGAPVGTLPRDRVFPTSTAPTRWQLSRSNGVAVGSDWSDACRRAWFELAERDRILRSWYGHGPAPIRVDFGDCELSRMRRYTWEAYRFASAATWTADLDVVMVVGFPRDASAPLVRGSAAGFDVRAAFQAASRECRQSLAFLWGESIPISAPHVAPTPGYHLDAFLWPHAHERLRAWLHGTDRRDAPATSGSDASVRYVDLTPPIERPAFRVARALCDDAMPLVFGDVPATVICDHARRGVHPIA